MDVLGLPDFPFGIPTAVEIVAAIATTAAALAAAWQAREVRRTVHEQREDRRFAYQPYLDVYEQPNGSWVIENVGRGIALKCAVFTWDVQDVQGYGPMMALGEKQRKPIDPWPIAPGARRADDMFEGIEHLQRLDVAICEDELGNLHRFGPYAVHNVSRRGEENPPAWTRYRRFYPDTEV